MLSAATTARKGSPGTSQLPLADNRKRPKQREPE
jgi:hypothetical protein